MRCMHVLALLWAGVTGVCGQRMPPACGVVRELSSCVMRRAQRLAQRTVRMMRLVLEGPPRPLSSLGRQCGVSVLTSTTRMVSNCPSPTSCTLFEDYARWRSNGRCRRPSLPESRSRHTVSHVCGVWTERNTPQTAASATVCPMPIERERVGVAPRGRLALRRLPVRHMGS